NRLLILGDMRELGDAAAKEHEQIGRLASELQIDRLLICGSHAEDVARGAARHGMKPHQIVAAHTAETLLTILDLWLQPNDLLLVKGSRVTRMEQIIDWLKDRAFRDERFAVNQQQKYCA